MKGAADGPLPGKFARERATRWLGRPRRAFTEVDSTNASLLRWAKSESAPHGALCVAEAQSRGRGRQGRLWHSPPGGNLYFSFLLRPHPPLGRFAPFSLVCALVIVETIADVHPGLPLVVKWPNDVWSGTRKLGGVLLESRDGADPLIVVGIGLNLREPPEGWGALHGRVTSLQEQGVDLAREELLDDLLPALEKAFDRFERRGFAAFVSAFNARSVLRERRVLIEQGDQTEDAVAMEVESDGALRVRDAYGQERTLLAGEVHLRPGAWA